MNPAVIFFVVYFSVAFAGLLDKDLLKKVSEDDVACLNEYGINPDALFSTYPPSEKENVKNCTIACAARSAKIIKPDGTLTKEASTNFLYLAAYNRCKKEPDTCKRAKCMFVKIEKLVGKIIKDPHFSLIKN